MRPESLRLLQQAVRINPAAKIAAIAQEHPRSKDDLAEALIDVYVDTAAESKDWQQSNWDAALEELDNDPRTLTEFMDSPAVRALIRAQEATHAAS
jgi:hypothetical protein